MKIPTTIALSCAIIILSPTSNVMAQGSVAAKIGTLGAGLEYMHTINPKLAVGLGINGLSYDTEIEESDINYDADLNMQTVSLLGDYHPWGNGFRISGGIMSNGNEFDLVATPTSSESVEINGNEYFASDVGSVNADIGFKSTAPYLGIGWGRPPRAGKGWGFDGDIGVLFQGVPQISLTVNCNSALSTADCDAIQTDAAAEEASLKADAEDFDIFPVISLGISYRF